MSLSKYELLAVYSNTARQDILKKAPDGKKPAEFIIDADDQVQPVTAFFNPETGLDRLFMYLTTYPDALDVVPFKQRFQGNADTGTVKDHTNLRVLGALYVAQRTVVSPVQTAEDSTKVVLVNVLRPESVM